MRHEGVYSEVGIKTPNPPPTPYSVETQISLPDKHCLCTDNTKTQSLCKTHTGCSALDAGCELPMAIIASVIAINGMSVKHCRWAYQ